MRDTAPRHLHHDRNNHAAQAIQRARAGLLLYGSHAVSAALCNTERRLHHLFVSPTAHEQLLARTDITGLPPISVMDRTGLDQLLGRKVAEAGQAVHQGFVLHTDALEQPDLEEWLYSIEPAGHRQRVLVLDQVTDPRNVGAVLRSARALYADAVIMTERHAPPETGALAKAATGALETVPVIKVVNLARAAERLKDHAFTLVGLEAGGSSRLDSFAQTERLALVLGSEGAGMRRLTREACDCMAAIEIAPESESLNVSVAASIALYATSMPGQ